MNGGVKVKSLERVGCSSVGGRYGKVVRVVGAVVGAGLAWCQCRAKQDGAQGAFGRQGLRQGLRGEMQCDGEGDDGVWRKQDGVMEGSGFGSGMVMTASAFWKGSQGPGVWREQTGLLRGP